MQKPFLEPSFMLQKGRCAHRLHPLDGVCYGTFFKNSKVINRLGKLQSNARKLGFYLQIPEDVSICGPLRIDCLPKQN